MFFRAIALIVVMSALLLLYRLHPIAGWATLMFLFAVTMVRRKRAGVVVRE